MTSLQQKSLLGLTILTTLGLVALLASRKRFVPEPHKRDGLLLEMISNVSSELDSLEAGLEDMATRVDLARNRLGRLVALHRENLLVCAILRETRRRANASKENSRNVGKHEHGSTYDLPLATS